MSESAVLIDAVLIPPGTVLSAKGDSPAVEISSSESRVFLLDLKIAEAAEQECIELSLLGSADGVSWGPQPLATLPQRFYPGDYPTLIDLSADPAARFVRVHWELARWGRGEQAARFCCGATLREVPADLLKELRAEGELRKG